MAQVFFLKNGNGHPVLWSEIWLIISRLKIDSISF